MSICQFIVALYFIASYMLSSLVAPTKSQLVRARANVTDIYTVTQYTYRDLAI